MTPSITLTISRGALTGKKYIFHEPTNCIIGRSRDCTIALGGEYLDVSRRHCVIEITPPELRIRDLGSLNGTYVNGQMIGQRSGGARPADGSLSSSAVELTAGDEIQLGDHTAFRVWVTPPAAVDTGGRKPRSVSGELQAHLSADRRGE
jgi:pSer/pThr/pTyr-binding forkhead associated (FHA) protein